MIDKKYCMSIFLMYRYLFDINKLFSQKFIPHPVNLDFYRVPIVKANDLLDFLQSEVRRCTLDGKAAIALSGGIDSAILAKLMPKGSTAYTFRCIVPGKQVVDETPIAAEYARRCGLQHRIVEIKFQDIERSVNDLMRKKGGPIHSIECQIYLAGLKIRSDGFLRCIYGENADIIYGGMDKLLQKDWYFGEFVDRYVYIMPYRVLYEPVINTDPFIEFERHGHIDAYGFTNKYFRQEALGSYTNACEAAGLEFCAPFAKTELVSPLDLGKIRAGETKYLVREVFRKLYPDMPVPQKIPMPRPVTEWFASWSGPHRAEFLPHCADTLSGDQRWMLWSLERFLDMVDKEEMEYV